MTGFYIKRNTWLKWIKPFQVSVTLYLNFSNNFEFAISGTLFILESVSSKGDNASGLTRFGFMSQQVINYLFKFNNQNNKLLKTGCVQR